jgi:hypothetical protein
MKKISILSLFFCMSAHGVTVSFSSTPDARNSSSSVVVGALPCTFTPEQMQLDEKMQTYLSLTGTADECVSFKGNWEYDQSADENSPDWMPMSDMAPFKFQEHVHHIYCIRCTTKPAYSLIISSVRSIP